MLPVLIQAVLALLALAVGRALHPAVEALAVLLEAVGLLAVADPLGLLQLQVGPVLLLRLALVLAPRALADLATFPGWVSRGLPWVKHSQ